MPHQLDNKQSVHRDPETYRLGPNPPRHHLTEPDPNFLFVILCGPGPSWGPEQLQKFDYSTLGHHPGIPFPQIDTDRLVCQITSVADIEI